ncbi:hypothetical protein U1Q18_052346 [Sarracenia purpurea var. burkii]
MKLHALQTSNAHKHGFLLQEITVRLFVGSDGVYANNLLLRHGGWATCLTFSCLLARPLVSRLPLHLPLLLHPVGFVALDRANHGSHPRSSSLYRSFRHRLAHSTLHPSFLLFLATYGREIGEVAAPRSLVWSICGSIDQARPGLWSIVPLRSA